MVIILIQAVGPVGVIVDAGAANGRQSNVDFPASDLVAEVALTGYKHMSVNLAYQINPYTQHTDKSEISVQYRPDPTRVINMGYRFQEAAVIGAQTGQSASDVPLVLCRCSSHVRPGRTMAPLNQEFGTRAPKKSPARTIR